MNLYAYDTITGIFVSEHILKNQLPCNYHAEDMCNKQDMTISSIRNIWKDKNYSTTSNMALGFRSVYLSDQSITLTRDENSAPSSL